MNSVISEEMALDLQQSLQAISAVESPQPHELLSSSIDWHRGSDYYLHESTDKECLRWLLLFTDIRAQSNNKQSIPSGSRLKAFLAISNAVKTSPDSPPVSLANFLTGSCEAGFELMEGEGGFAQSLALQACRSSFNLPYLISLLGQGYKLVISGHRFGGIVAHALSTQLLLQVKSEILLAEKMGVDLSSLALTHEGVTSFALSSPLFASGSLGGVLDAHGLSGALNTLWHKQDSSPLFLTECCNLMNSSSPQPKAPSQQTLALRTIPFASPWIKAATTWAAFFQEEVSKLPRAKSQAWVTVPLEVSSASSPHGMKKERVEGPALIEKSSSLSREKTPSSQSGASPLPKEKSATLLSRSVSVAAGKSVARVQSISRKVVAPTPGSSSSRDNSPLPSPTPSFLSPSTAAAPLTKLLKPQLANLISNIPGLRSAGKDAEEGTPETLKPTGCFWTLVEHSPPVATAGGKTSTIGPPPSSSLASLVPLPARDVYSSLDSSLSDNRQLIDKWEFGVEEWIKVLPEAFTWTKFKNSIQDANGAVTQRTIRHLQKI